MSAGTERWFASIGTPLDTDDFASLRALVAQLPLFTAVDVAQAPAEEALALAAAIETDGSWWELQESAREQLWLPCADRHGEQVLSELLAGGDEAAAPGIALAAGRALSGSTAAVRAAREAAQLAVHHALLARLAGAEDHWFVHKHALFEGGRWVLGVHRNRLWIA